MKILIVDDSPDALALARARLSRESYELLCADSGGDGLEMADRHRPDLILLDIDMPDLSGFDVCRILKENPELCMIPVIFLSGSGTAEDKVRGLDVGAVDYVTKPFDAFELRARVNAALRTKRLQDLLIERAKIDPLTGLSNRRAMLERLQKEWARAQRHGGTMSFVMADVDHFKKFNDTYGHAAGDRALAAVAMAIAGQCRLNDLPSRFGGEEFAIVVPDEPADGAARLAERCRKAVADTELSVVTETVRVTASFGVSDAGSADSPDAMVRQADTALYRAKEAGRNCVETASPGPIRQTP